MSATDKTYDAKHVQLPGEADSRETLKAFARLLARQAAAVAVGSQSASTATIIKGAPS